jgi:hypothetical protein
MRANIRKSLTVDLALIGVFVLASTSFGQHASAYKPDSWQSLTLDQSTPGDAVHTLGQPVSDKSDRLHIYNIDAWITPKHKQKIFRVLTYEKVGDAKKVRLSFLDNKLVRIFIVYAERKFPAKDLKERFGVDFVLVDGKVPSGSDPLKYEGRTEVPVTEGYPAAYEEVEHAVEAVRVSCVEALRYSGDDPEILERLRAKGCISQSDVWTRGGGT